MLLTGLQTTGSNATTLANRNVVVPLILLNNYYEYDSGSYRLDTATWANLRKELKPVGESFEYVAESVSQKFARLRPNL